jgi:hypothetical protein
MTLARFGAWRDRWRDRLLLVHVVDIDDGARGAQLVAQGALADPGRSTSTSATV